MEKVTIEENGLHETLFSEEEIKRAIDGSYAGGYPVVMASLSCSIRSSGM
jgi:hypothetical protein